MNVESEARVSWEVRALMLVGMVGMAARFVMAALSVGCNDVGIWYDHAHAVLAHGVRYAFETRAIYNHPPLMGYWSAVALKLAGPDIHRFSLWLKLPGLLVEVLCAVLVYRVAARRGRRAGARAFAAYGVSLVSIIVAGYHGNTDPVYAGLTLLSAYALEACEAPFWAGAALALALNVKLIPIFLIPPLLARCRSRRAAGLFVAGLALGIVPFLPFLLTIPRIMYRNMLAYNSLKDEWGLGAFFNYGAWGGTLAPFARAVAAFYIPIGRYVILVGVLIVAVAAHLRQRWNAYELGALGWASFLIFTPGFGVQYTVCIVPLLFAADVGRALLYSTFTGVFLGVINAFSLPWKLPLSAAIHAPYAPVAVLFGILGWAGLVRFVNQTFVRRLLGRAPALDD